jgi:hypothetical protein
LLQDRLLRDVATHQAANQTYIEKGVQLLNLAHRAHDLFERQEPAGKRRLLSFLLSNCVWKVGMSSAEYRQPFDMLALAREAGGGDEAMSGGKSGQFVNWLPVVDSFRTPAACPPPAIKMLLPQIQTLACAGALCRTACSTLLIWRTFW